MDLVRIPTIKSQKNIRQIVVVAFAFFTVFPGQLFSQWGSKTIHDTVPQEYLLSFRNADKVGFMNLEGEVIIPATYYSANMFLDGLVTVAIRNENNSRRTTHYGALNAKGEMVVPIGPYFCSNMGNGYILVEKGRSNSIYNEKGEEIISCDTCNLGRVFDTDYFVEHKGIQRDQVNDLRIYDLNGNYKFSEFGTMPRRMWNIRSVDRKYNPMPYIMIDIDRKNRIHRIINMDGSLFLDSVSFPIGFYDNISTMYKDGLCSLIDTSFNPIVPFSEGYESISRFSNEKDRILFSVLKNGHTGIIDNKGQLVLPVKYEGTFNNHQGFLAIYNHGTYKYSYLNGNGENIAKEEWEMHESYLDPNSDQKWFRVSTSDRKYGVIDKEGQVVIPISFDFLSPINNGALVFFNGEESGYMNLKGEVLAKVNQPWVSEIREGVGIIGVPQLNRGRADFPCAQIVSSVNEVYAMQYQYIDSMGNPLSDYLFDWAFPFVNGFGKAMSQCQRIWLDKNIEPVKLGDLYLQSEFDNDLAVAMNTERKFGLVNAKGEIVVPCEYDNIKQKDGSYVHFNVYNKTQKPKRQSAKQMYPDVFNGMIRVYKDGYWGLVSTNGEVILKPVYTYIKLIGEDHFYSVVNQKDKRGIIKLDGTVLLPLEYDDIGQGAPYGLFSITKNGVSGYVHLSGKIYWPKL